MLGLIYFLVLLLHNIKNIKQYISSIRQGSLCCFSLTIAHWLELKKLTLPVQKHIQHRHKIQHTQE